MGAMAGDARGGERIAPCPCERRVPRHAARWPQHHATVQNGGVHVWVQRQEAAGSSRDAGRQGACTMVGCGGEKRRGLGTHRPVPV